MSRHSKCPTLVLWRESIAEFIPVVKYPVSMYNICLFNIIYNLLHVYIYIHMFFISLIHSKDQ